MSHDAINRYLRGDRVTGTYGTMCGESSFSRPTGILFLTITVVDKNFSRHIAESLTSQAHQLRRLLAPMVQRIKTWLSSGKEVHIFTARAETPSGVRAVQYWLQDNGLPRLVVTNVKNSQMTALWDDKAMRVVKKYWQALLCLRGC